MPGTYRLLPRATIAHDVTIFPSLAISLASKILEIFSWLYPKARYPRGQNPIAHDVHLRHLLSNRHHEVWTSEKTTRMVLLELRPWTKQQEQRR